MQLCVTRKTARGYVYTFESICNEDKNLILKDGRRSVFLSTKGENEQDVSQPLINFLSFVKAGPENCEEDFHDEFVERLQKSVKHVKESREMEERFMLFQEMLKEERAEGREEGRAEGRAEGRVDALIGVIISLLEEKGVIPEELKDRIKNEKDVDVLEQWVKLAAKTQSIEQFLGEF